MEAQTRIKFRDSIGNLSAGIGVQIALRNCTKIPQEILHLLEITDEYCEFRKKLRSQRGEKAREFLKNPNA